MSTKTLRNPKAVAKLKGKRFKHIPFKKQARYKIRIRDTLKKPNQPVQKPYREDAA